MKLLGWMHRKFRQNSTDPFKDQLVIGQAAVDEEHNKYSKHHVKQSEKKCRRKSFPARVEHEEEYQHDEVGYGYGGGGSGNMYELFPGFLAIGTLGSSATPTFAISVEKITEKEDEEEEATENELKLINDELEKVLGGEAKEDHESYYYSSARNSHVSTGGGIIITDQSNAICPLQGYLLGSGIELSEKPKTLLLPNAKKEQTHRTSLGELFQRSKLADDQSSLSDNNNNNNIKRTSDQKEADKSHIMHLIKKKLKKRILHHHASSRSSSSTSTTAAADSDTKLLHKILHMFNKKVHPENSTAEHKFDKYEKNEKTTTISCDGDGSHINPEEDIVIHPKRSVAKEKMRQRRYKSQSNPFQFTLGSEEENSYENNNKEHWIKTDADYLVLEL